jgi:hypothetical protein
MRALLCWIGWHRWSKIIRVRYDGDEVWWCRECESCPAVKVRAGGLDGPATVHRSGYPVNLQRGQPHDAR